MKLCYKIGLKQFLQINEAFNYFKFYTDSFFSVNTRSTTKAQTYKHAIFLEFREVSPSFR